MSTILEADETGTLHLPAAMLPHPGPHRRYRVAAEHGQVVVHEEQAGSASDLVDWLLACPERDWFVPSGRAETTDEIKTWVFE